jgi:hypothetical protein
MQLLKMNIDLMILSNAFKDWKRVGIVIVKKLWCGFAPAASWFTAGTNDCRAHLSTPYIEIIVRFLRRAETLGVHRFLLA